MSLVVLLDSGPLGMVTHPGGSFETLECERWLESLVLRGADVVVPEIADYEVRRELTRAGKARSIARLNGLKDLLRYLPITTPAMLQAADYWAKARSLGRKTADDAALDGDMILARQATVAASPGDEAVVATTNIRHLSLFVRALHWREVR